MTNPNATPKAAAHTPPTQAAIAAGVAEAPSPGQTSLQTPQEYALAIIEALVRQADHAGLGSLYGQPGVSSDPILVAALNKSFARASLVVEANRKIESAEGFKMELKAHLVGVMEALTPTIEALRFDLAAGTCKVRLAELVAPQEIINKARELRAAHGLDWLGVFNYNPVTDTLDLTKASHKTKSGHSANRAPARSKPCYNGTQYDTWKELATAQGVAVNISTAGNAESAKEAVLRAVKAGTLVESLLSES